MTLLQLSPTPALVFDAPSQPQNQPTESESSLTNVSPHNSDNAIPKEVVNSNEGNDKRSNIQGGGSKRSWNTEGDKRKLRRVTFSEGSKSWDGLRRSEADFDELLFCFLVKGQSIGDGDILQWTGIDCERILNMCRLLSDLIARLRNEDPKNVGDKQLPCLPRGGGRAIKVERTYEPYLLSLLSVLATALQVATNSENHSSFDLLCLEDQELVKLFIRNKRNVESLIHLEKPLSVCA